MSREDYTTVRMSKKDIKTVLDKIEGNQYGLGKFRDTAIYSSFKYNYNSTVEQDEQ